jgi:hypothetical protein
MEKSKLDDIVTKLSTLSGSNVVLDDDNRSLIETTWNTELDDEVDSYLILKKKLALTGTSLRINTLYQYRCINEDLLLNINKHYKYRRVYTVKQGFQFTPHIIKGVITIKPCMKHFDMESARFCNLDISNLSIDDTIKIENIDILFMDKPNLYGLRIRVEQVMALLKRAMTMYHNMNDVDSKKPRADAISGWISKIMSIYDESDTSEAAEMARIINDSVSYMNMLFEENGYYIGYFNESQLLKTLSIFESIYSKCESFVKIYKIDNKILQ